MKLYLTPAIAIVEGRLQREFQTGGHHENENYDFVHALELRDLGHSADQRYRWRSSASTDRSYRPIPDRRDWTISNGRGWPIGNWRDIEYAPNGRDAVNSANYAAISESAECASGAGIGFSDWNDVWSAE